MTAREGTGTPLDLHLRAGSKLRHVDDLMPTGEFSERSGLSPKRLRTYAEVGLLVPAAVDSASGYRYYSPGQLRRAQLIDTLRQAGMPLADIGALLRRPSAEQLEAWARRVKAEAAQRQQAVGLARRLLAPEGPHPSIDHQSTAEVPMQKLTAASRTEIGQRLRNEDSVVTTDRLAVVADGMGGSPGGEIASAVAVGLIEAAFTGRSPHELEAAVRAANRAIWDRADASSELEGMGTTVCAAGLIGDGELAIVNVGDSRAYVLHSGSLTQLTQDHSVTADLVRRGELSEEEALGHPHRAVLTRALGVGRYVELDSASHPITPGARLLLCTDGLFTEVGAHEIASSMEAGRDVDETAGHLVDLALERGARDNVSVVVADVYEAGDRPA